MGGEDKSLIELNGSPLVDYIIAALRHQTGHIIINTNRNLERYPEFGYPVVPGMLDGYFGPLAGMATGMQTATTSLLLAVPCDSPFIPTQLCADLRIAMEKSDAAVSVAHDGKRMQPVYALLRCGLLSYLKADERRVDSRVTRQTLALADYSATPDCFLNVNVPADRQFMMTKLAYQAESG